MQQKPFQHRFCVHVSEYPLFMSAPSSPAAAAASPWSRDAWSEPLPTEIFTVEPQGPELDAAGLGVAIALEALMQDWHGPWVEKRAGGR